MSAILSVEHVGVRFGGLVAIADLHFDVHAGEIVSLIGPNGAGKTTAFNVMTGFLKPSQGDVRFRGTSLKDLSPHAITRLGLARTFQRTSVFPDDTVFDNVMIGLHRMGAAAGRVPVLDALLGRAAAA
ncbi:ATP-binding cassette domain-containing protein, partial [Methylobacterium oryzae]|uniref:ATP-binding cassette domain-containing protein n=1 Tax=Methylobacterium oryzae TaxID=334852 RepID=UPI002F3535E3